MRDIPDAGLLEQFARSASEKAFAELVRRHLPLVYSAAFRHTANPQNAQEITQAVFIILARKAASLGRRSVLSGWLYHTTRLTAANFQRAEFRRIHREQEAFMQSTLQESKPDAAWPEVAPLLDEAMARLGATDRDAVVLRYFENKSLAEVGTALGVEERAAQKRVTRALEKLRKLFSKRGVSLTATIIASAVSANSVQAAPSGLLVTVTATAAKGATMTTSIAALVKGTMQIMTWLKMKFWLGTATVLAGGVIAVGIGMSAFTNRQPDHASPGFAVSGTFSIEVTRPIQGRPKEIFGVFSVVYRDGKWLIRSKRFDEVHDYNETGFDGQSVYSISCFKTWAEENQKQGITVGVNIAEGAIIPGVVPYDDPEINKVLWLLYASSRYLAENPDKSLPALFSHSSPKAYLYGFRQRADWAVGDRILGLPQSVVYYDDGFIRRWEDDGGEGYMTGPPVSAKWAPPYDAGFTNAILSVSSANETNGNWIPRASTFTVYGPKRSGENRSDLDLYKTITINATNLAIETPIQDFKPSIDGVVLVTDMRLETDKKPLFQFSYLTDHRWLTIPDAKKRKEYPAALEAQRLRIAASKRAPKANAR